MFLCLSHTLLRISSVLDYPNVKTAKMLLSTCLITETKACERDRTVGSENV
jgi:hypothetical protein